ncbi:VPS9 domain containing protein [Salix suchowensis]|nr:VPS9 domain containing protein [Salix suchowensis]
MLDLGLEHLDIVVGDLAPELNLVVKACGESESILLTQFFSRRRFWMVVLISSIALTQLDVACRSPGDKAAVLVAAHKVVVEDEAPPSAQGESPTILLTGADAPATVLVAAATSLPEEEDSAQHLAREGEGEADAVVYHSPRAPQGANTRLRRCPAPHGHLLRRQSQPTAFGFALAVYATVSKSDCGREESYCLINLLAVAEFLENVDLAALGLNDVNKVMRVGQGVDAANKVINGVVDSSFTILRSIITNNPNNPLNINPSPVNAIPSPIDEQHASRPGFGLLRRQSSGFSLASIAASLPIPGARSKSVLEETGRPLLPVSRPSSVRSSHLKERADDDSSVTSTSQGSDDETGEDEEGGRKGGG